MWGLSGAASLGLVILAGAAGCGDGAEPASDPEPSTTSTAPAVEIVDFKFEPETTEVKPGTEVTWENADKAAHTASAADGSFDTGTIDQGESGSATLTAPGTYAYICEFHPFMKGTIEVK